MNAILALEDGTVYHGSGFGAQASACGEVCFNTSMTGYQEILTDPSYKGQIVTMTCPHIGNYGVNEDDVESAHPWVSGFVGREFSTTSSNHRATQTLDAYLKKHGIVAIDDVDTRALTRRLRMAGAMNGVISTIDLDDASLVEKARRAPSMNGLDLVKEVTCDTPKPWREFVEANGEARSKGKYRVALFDCGAKWNIVRLLAGSG